MGLKKHRINIKPSPLHTDSYSLRGKELAILPWQKKIRENLFRIFLIILLWGTWVVEGSTASQAVSSPPSAPLPEILILGDSLSAEYGIPRGEGWVTLLQKSLNQHGLAYQIRNLSLSGDTTAAALARWDKIHTGIPIPAWVIIELGANDGLRGLSLEAMRSNLSHLITSATQQGSRVLLVGMRIPPNFGARYADQFYAVYPQLAQKHQIPLVPFIMDGFADNPAWFQRDGIHPLPKAQARMLDNVWSILFPLLKNQSSPKPLKKTLHQSTTP